MSEFLYDEVGVDGTVGTWKKGDWKSIAVHSDTEIKGFFGEYRWLSNFHESELKYDGLIYRSSENAYQAAKVLRDNRQYFQTCSPTESKKLWKLYLPAHSIPEEWDARKFDIMAEVVLAKFRDNKELRQRLLNTGDKYLEETNWWGDVYFGVCRGKGKNALGNILMLTRAYFRTMSKFEK